MLICISGQLYYSAEVVWLITSALLVIPPAFAAFYWYQSYVCPTWVTNEWLLFIIDHTLAGILLSNVLYPFLTLNLTTNDSRVEIFALRCASALLASIASVALIVQLIPRPILAAGTMLLVGVSLNASCWWATVWLNLQASGLAPLLPEAIRRALLEDRLLDWLRNPVDFALLAQRLHQLMPLILLPEDELHHGLAMLPASLRARLQQPGERQRRACGSHKAWRLTHSFHLPFAQVCFNSPEECQTGCERCLSRGRTGHTICASSHFR